MRNLPDRICTCFLALLPVAASIFASGAVEKEIWVWEFAGASGPGFYFSAPDRAPKPGEFTDFKQGMLRVGALVVTFTLLSNSGQDALLNHGLGMLRSAAPVQE